MGGLRLVLRRASPSDFQQVIGLITEASRWLRSKGTDQWAKPWPDENGRDERVSRAIKAGHTWIASDGGQSAATLTASPDDYGIWPEEFRHESAVYVRRLVVGRQYAGHCLGAQLLDWAGLRASHEYDARWIRVDVWTTNTKLHAYYLGQGFQHSGRCPIRGYPSAALFQKPTDQIAFPKAPLFHEDPTTAWEWPQTRRMVHR